MHYQFLKFSVHQTKCLADAKHSLSCGQRCTTCKVIFGVKSQFFSQLMCSEAKRLGNSFILLKDNASP